MNSGAALATVVGVLVEVPVMLSLVAIMKKKKSQFYFPNQQRKV
jgi:ACR3 family arsenite transporter